MDNKLYKMHGTYIKIDLVYLTALPISQVMQGSRLNKNRSNIIFIPWRNSSQWATASPVLRIHDHTQIHHSR